ncbi:MAG: EthD family reductase [Bryobacteraceae bacterium]|nr:EthD family reductase [Bryobacteraceae bacterium]
MQALAGTAPHRIATLDFDSLADIQMALPSPEGQAAAADWPNFANGWATLLIFDSLAV